MLNKRRIVIDVTRPGWIGWILFALLIVPLLVVSILFAAILIPIVLILLLVAGVRLYWLMRKVRQGSGPVDITPASVYEADTPGDVDASPPRQLPPPPA